jgi:hypothetical protein
MLGPATAAGMDRLPPRHSYRLYGLTLSSELPLPLPCGAGTPDVTLEPGPVPADGDLVWEIDDPIRLACHRSGDRIQLISDAVRFDVGADRIAVETRDPALAAHLVMGSVWTLVLAARGGAAIHGTVVAGNGRGVAVLGASGSGKSTAGLAMLDRGWRLAADDLLVFDDQLRVIPGPPFVRLTADRAVGREGDVDAGGKVRYFPAACSEAVPLAAIVIHVDGISGAARMLPPFEAVSILRANAYVPLPNEPSQAQRRFDLILRLAACVPIYAAPPRSLDPDWLSSLVDKGIP